MLSFIIVTRNRPEKLRRCLESIEARVAAPHEVIVIDNSTINTGSTAARNKGARESRPDSTHLIFLDDDAWIESLPLQNMIEYLQCNLDVALIAPRILNPDNTPQASIRSFPTLVALAWRATGLYKIFPNAPWYTSYIDPAHRMSNGEIQSRDPAHISTNANIIQDIDWAISACILMSKKSFTAISGFDEKYFFMHEDTDLCLRLAQKGYKRVYWPNATIYHDYARQSRNILSVAFLHHIRGAVRILWRLRNWNSYRSQHVKSAEKPRSL